MVVALHFFELVDVEGPRGLPERHAEEPLAQDDPGRFSPRLFVGPPAPFYVTHVRASSTAMVS